MKKTKKKSATPRLYIDVSKGTVFLGAHRIPFSPVEFAYYRFFAERILTGSGPVRAENKKSAPEGFLKSVVAFHEESFPEMYDFRRKLDRMMKENKGLRSATFRATIARMNSKIRKTFADAGGSRMHEIVSTGPRGAREFHLDVPKKNISVSLATVGKRFGKHVRVLKSEDSLKEALELMNGSDFYQVVVRDAGKLRLLTTGGIAEWLAAEAKRGAIDVNKNRIKQVLDHESRNTFRIVDAECSVGEVRRYFSDRLSADSVHLYAVIITENGTPAEEPLGIITPWDFLDQNYW